MPIINGTAESDNLLGTAEADEIRGLAGNDNIDGAGGADAMDGGLGDDVFIVDHAGDRVYERSGEGTDEIRSSVNYVLPAFVERLVLTGSAIYATGNSLNNQIIGNDVDNVLRGGGGSDLFVGGFGNDTYIVEGTITVIDEGGYAFGEVDQVIEADGGGTDLIISNISHTLGANVENLRLVGTANLAGFGNELGNRIIGNDGNNFIRGGAGNDYLDGGLGADSLDGGDGDDIYVIDNELDHLGVESPAESGGIDTVIASIDHTLAFGFENLTLTGAAVRGTGNSHDNRIVGNAGANVIFGDGGNDRIDGREGNDDLNGGFGDDYIYGGAGDDLIEGGPGIDRLIGGAGDDVYIVRDSTDFIYELAGEGHDRAYSAISFALRDHVEQLNLTGSSNITGTGNNGNNVIVGNDGSNRVYGYGGDDRLAGGLGSDQIDGGAGNDGISGEAGDDRLYGGDGNDQLNGGAGRDIVVGGAGADLHLFRDGDFGGADPSSADIIRDFSSSEGDRIRLDLVDSDQTSDGDQAFTFVGTAAFTGTAGELRYEQIGANTFISGDTDGDGNADFMIRLDGLNTIQEGDFFL